jgi:glycosyltransferase involved in cell wall biosynthesis
MREVVTVSVVIPTYNRAALLRESLESVAAQTYRDFEILVVDDGSTDDTRSVVESSGARWIPIGHSGLQAAVRNRGIEQAQGEYVAFLDSDDRWLPEKLKRQVELLRERPEFALTCCNAHRLVDGKHEGLLHRPGTLRTGDVFDALLKRNFVVNSSVLVRRATLTEVGGLDEDPALKSVEDYDLWLRIASTRKVHSFDDPLVDYRIHPGNESWDVEQTQRGLARCYEKVLQAGHGRGRVAARMRRLRLIARAWWSSRG